MSEWLTDWLTDLLTDWLTYWLIDWLIILIVHLIVRLPVHIFDVNRGSDIYLVPASVQRMSYTPSRSFCTLLAIQNQWRRVDLHLMYTWRSIMLWHLVTTQSQTFKNVRLHCCRAAATCFSTHRNIKDTSAWVWVALKRRIIDNAVAQWRQQPHGLRASIEGGHFNIFFNEISKQNSWEISSQKY